MPITDEIKKTLTDPTPLYALAGAGDLAYEKLREVPGRVEALASDPKGAQEKAAARFQEAQSLVAGAQAKVTEAVTALPTDLNGLQERAQGFALQQVARAVELAVKAREAYDELAERGKVAVEKARPGAATEAAEATEPAVEPVEIEAAEPVEPAEAGPKKTGRARKAADDR
ncbi:hypothetical protein [Streptomyces rubellomurinus]|uniref:Heparin-binding hemagglutinin n=1 Tax=Streptomyces rubellomurinus (strain ATCC 31215) TaxID=359131 RepID=A0A0F2TDL0_STRR3|nr:hypothetical protein [Streptomyces rubellomurinus]KJS61273.1 hypothetical protein VM95_16265 [Streptomyces rubellomurinus]